MSRLVKFFITAIFVLTAGSAYSAELKSTTVAGFINKGAAKDANFNIQMTKSMIAFMSKLSKNVSTYQEVSSAAAEQGFWKKKVFDSSDAINLAQSLNTEQVISGDYLVDGNSIVINIQVYDVITGNLKLGRHYTGSSGVDVFDSIDKIIKDVSGLLIGKTVETGKFKLGIVPDKKTYKHYINGSYIKPVSKKAGYFEDSFLAGQLEVSLKAVEDDKEIYRNFFTIVKDKTTEYNYSPLGSILVKVMDGESDIFLNGVLYGRTDKTGAITISNVTAGQDMQITSKAVDSSQGKTTVKVLEGEAKVVVLESPAHQKRYFYFPLQLGLMGGYMGQAGVDFYLTPNFSFGLLGGVLVNQFGTNSNWGILPVITLKTGAYLPFNENFRIGLALTGNAVIGQSVVMTPAACVEIEAFHINIAGGMRYSLSDGNLYPLISGGYRF